MIISKIQFKDYSIKDFFIVLCVILLSKSLYYESLGTNFLLIIFLLFLLILVDFKSFKFQKIIIFYILGMLILLLLNQDTNFRSLLVLINRILISIIIINLINFQRFSKIFVDIILMISVFSYFSWIIIFFDINSFLPNFTGIDGRQLRNFVFFGVWENFINYKVLRNSGLWWEPGAFQLFVNMAFIFSLVNNTMTIKRYIIFLITIITITSTTGFLSFLLLSLIYFKKYFTFKKKDLIFITFFLILTIFASIYIAPLVYDKFNVDSSSFSSFLSRYYDVLISLNMFLNNIFTGYGYGSQIEKAIPFGENLIGYDLYYLTKPSGADGITMFISQIGIVGFILIIPFLFPKYYSHMKLFYKLLISLALFIMFNTENFTFLLIFTLLTFYGLMKNNLIEERTKL